MGNSLLPNTTKVYKNSEDKHHGRREQTKNFMFQIQIIHGTVFV